MRITFFTNQSLESASGIGRHLPLARELIKLGHKVTILCLHHNLKELKKRVDFVDGVKVVNVGQMHVLKEGDFKFYFNKFQLFKIIVKSTFMMFLYGMITKTDLIYLCKPQPINSTAALLVRFFKNKKLVLDYDDYEANANKFNNKIEKKVFELFENHVPKLSNHISVNTLFLKERLIKLGYPEGKIFYMSNGVDRERFKKIDMEKLASLKKELKVKNKKVILYFGAMDLKTGHPVDLLIKSFKLLREEIPDVKLILIGGGSDLEELKRLSESLGLKDDVIFLGRISSNLIPTYIKLGDVSVDPVTNDPGCDGRSPLKIFESMLMKIPVVTGSLIDRSYLLGNGKYGYLVNPGDESSLKEGMANALNDPEAKEKVNLAFEQMEKYDWTHLSYKFNEMLTALKS